ncbi:hypothetical protein T12_8738 [Trichinella patagoniensis]|uniref:Uncharacterized protein n=1 Tax=Trichinella patagoniensis TaxID=990121 RepID=A0A0V0ZTN3_9BILA|nr:hypothetical protein T12_8738 [Trichinella patagoniensis]
MVQECKSTESMPISQAGSSNVRLPKLEIKKFSGEYHDWQRFYDEFEATINSNPTLNCFRGLILNAVNYETLTILNEKYGDSQPLIEEHLKSLQNLPVIMNQWDLKRLEKFVSDMEINIRGLETLKTTPVVYQAVLMPLILSRLPRKISVEWKRQNPNRQKDMYVLLSFLKTGLRSRKVSTFPWREKKPVFPFLSNRKTVPREQYTTAALRATDKPSVSENQPNTSAIKTVNPHAVYHHEQLDELGRLAPEDPRPVMEIYDEFARDIHAWMDGWANRLELQLTAEHTKTKSGEQFLMYHSPTNDILIFATDPWLLAQSNCCDERTVTEIGSPLMYFKKYFTDEMFQYIADKSTTYAVQNNNLRVHFSTHDIELFVGALLKMGIIPMSRYRIGQQIFVLTVSQIG